VIRGRAGCARSPSARRRGRSATGAPRRASCHRSSLVAVGVSGTPARAREQRARPPSRRARPPSRAPVAAPRTPARTPRPAAGRLGCRRGRAGADRVRLPVDDDEVAVLREHEVDAAGGVAVLDAQGVGHLAPQLRRAQRPPQGPALRAGAASSSTWPAGSSRPAMRQTDSATCSRLSGAWRSTSSSTLCIASPFAAGGPAPAASGASSAPSRKAGTGWWPSSPLAGWTASSSRAARMTSSRAAAHDARPASTSSTAAGFASAHSAGSSSGSAESRSRSRR